jgi:acetoin utilization deacetylase AcuC-like enzyme
MTIAIVGDPRLSCGRYFSKLTQAEVDFTRVAPRSATAAQIKRFHDATYADKTLTGWSEEWVGRRPDLAKRAAMTVGSTLRAVAAVAQERHRRVFVPDGGRPHASYKASDRGCAFNDVIISAEWATRRGLDVAIVDIDGLYAPALEYMTRYNEGVTTISIHDSSPDAGRSVPDLGTYNFPLDEDAGDMEFIAAVDKARMVIEDVVPDLVIVNVGSTAHIEDELTTLTVSLEAIYEAMIRLCSTTDEIANGRMVALGGVASAHSEWQSTIMAAATHAMTLSYLRSSATRAVPNEFRLWAEPRA